jgi:hypothetical protein
VKLANRVYLALLAEEHLRRELLRPWDEICAAVGPYTGDPDPIKIRTMSVDAEGCEPPVEVTVFYTPLTNRSIDVQVRVNDADRRGTALFARATVDNEAL